MVKLNSIYNKFGKNLKVKEIQDNLSKIDTETNVMLDNGVWYSEENEIDDSQEQRIF
jgi:hypothetical protein